jgi:branched-chain amino acid transport system permease protein
MDLLQQVANGLGLGFVYALIAIGLTLIFGVLNVVNFAHGEVYTLGAFAGVALVTLAPLPLPVLLAAACLAGAAAGWALERAAFRPLRRFRDEASQKSRLLRESTLLSSLALSIVVKEALDLWFGGAMLPIPPQVLLQSPIRLGPVVLTDGLLLIVACSVGALLFLQWVLRRTATGLSIRAVASNRLGAQHTGVDIDRTVVMTFVLGSALGGLGGLLVGLYDGSVFPGMGFNPGVKAFIAMVMGGLTSLPGAVLCALLLGVSEAVATDLVGSGWKEVVPYLLLLVTLWLFPRGLFGGAKERV